MPQRSFLTLSQLCLKIQDALYQKMEAAYWVKAEIASLTVNKGHAYFELIEKSAIGEVVAKSRATCWRSIFSGLHEEFMRVTDAALHPGLEVLLNVEVQYHAVYGLALNIIHIDPVFTLGEFQKQKNLTISLLQKEGLWDKQKQLSLPILVRQIAVVSSSTAAGYEDFCVQLQETGLPFEVKLFHASMQGAEMEQSIIDALETISKDAARWDVVIIIRGGGDTIDLSYFNSYILCRHVARFPLPIITGVGHTRDVSILDQIAFLSLKNPTAVASFFVQLFYNQVAILQTLRDRLYRTMEQQILLCRHKIELLRQQLHSLSPISLYQKGYCVVLKDNQPITSIKQVALNDNLTVSLTDGNLKVRVNELSETHTH